MSKDWNQDCGRQPGETAIGETLFAVPKPYLLDGFTELNASSSGVNLHQMGVNDLIHIQTQNSEYRVLLLDPIELRVRVQGGNFFAEPTEAIIRGATVGGSMLKMGWISVGLQIELVYYSARDRTQSLVTSPVKNLLLERGKYSGNEVV